MKTKFILLIIFLSILLFSQACKKEESTSVTPSLTLSTAQASIWKVTLYKEDLDDKTTYYTNYAFTFNVDLSVEAVITGSSQINGTYAISEDNSQVKFVLSFTAVNNFDKITNDWRVETLSSTKIALRDISGRNGGIDYLTFERI